VLLLLLLLRRGVRRRSQRCVRTRNGHGGVLLLAGRSVHVVVVSLEAWGDGGQRWRNGLRAGRGIEAVLAELGGCAGDLDGGRLQGEGLGLDDLADLGVLDLAFVAVVRLTVGVHVVGVAWRWTPAA